MSNIVEMGTVVGVMALCAALGVARATYYRRNRAASALAVVAAATPTPGDGPGVAVVALCALEPGAEAPEQAAAILEAPAELDVQRAATNDVALKASKLVPRALTVQQRSQVLEQLNSLRFVDLSPAETYATLLDEGVYLASERTMYRILAEHAEVRERRNQRRHPIYAAPELMASKVNQVWTWDITKLRGPVKGEYFHLYVMLDMYSRYVVGWQVSISETAAQAESFINETCALHKISRGQLTIHADRGTSMKSKPVALLLADLGVLKSHSRPSVSDDNPFSEAQFKTLKYRPDFPDRFGSLEDARAHCVRFFRWYNTEHHHSGIASLTPHDVFHGLAEQRLKERTAVLDAAYAAHPERFVSAPPRPTPLPDAVWINRPKARPLEKTSSPSGGMLDGKVVDDGSQAKGVGLVRAILATAIVEVGSELPFVKINDDKLEICLSKNRLLQMGGGLGTVDQRA